MTENPIRELPPFTKHDLATFLTLATRCPTKAGHLTEQAAQRALEALFADHAEPLQVSVLRALFSKIIPSDAESRFIETLWSEQPVHNRPWPRIIAFLRSQQHPHDNPILAWEAIDAAMPYGATGVAESDFDDCFTATGVHESGLAVDVVGELNGGVVQKVLLASDDKKFDQAQLHVVYGECGRSHVEPVHWWVEGAENEPRSWEALMQPVVLEDVST